MISDVIGLAYKWNLPVRNRPAQGVLGGNGTNQISLVFKDLLMDMKASQQDVNAFSLTEKLKEVKKFSYLSDELKDVLFQESVMFVDQASRTLRENKKEIAMLNKQCQYNQELITASGSGSERSFSPKEILNNTLPRTPNNGNRRSRTQDRFANRSKIGLGDRLEVGQRRGDESIEPMSKVKDWKGAFELSLIKINEQKNSITKLSKLCLGALNAIDRIESNIETEKENAKKQIEQRSSGEVIDKENDISKDKESVVSELKEVLRMVDILKEKVHCLENQSKSPPSEIDLRNNVKDLIHHEFSEKHKNCVDELETKEIVKEVLQENKILLNLKENLGRFIWILIQIF